MISFLFILQGFAVSHFNTLLCWVFVLGKTLMFYVWASFKCFSFGLNYNVFVLGYLVYVLVLAAFNGSFGLYFDWGFDSELEVCVALFAVVLNHLKLKLNHVSVSSFS